ncbi:MAG: hypothetical protein H7X71_01955 [Chitinophagales bacterium]|nr:hypothetical protein [Chitinophagales bacterium]
MAIYAVFKNYKPSEELKKNIPSSDKTKQPEKNKVKPVGNVNKENTLPQQKKQTAQNKDTDNFAVNLAKPAQRALLNAGITTLKQLSKLTEEEISNLHGVGQNAVQQIKKALTENGLAFAKKKK